MRFVGVAIPVTVLAAALFFLLRTDPYGVYLQAAPGDQGALRALFEFLDRDGQSPENRFTVLDQISQHLIQNGAWTQSNLFLTSYANQHAEDPYRGFYLYRVAETYRQNGAPDFAVPYYERVLNNHADLRFEGDSLHFRALNRLIQIAPDPAVRLSHLQDLVARFNDRVTPVWTHYHLGRTYEHLGEWTQAMQSYQTFLDYPEGASFAQASEVRRIRALVDFHKSNKDWVRPDVNALLNPIRLAVQAGNAAALDRLRSKVGFFVVSVDNKAAEFEAEGFEPSTFLRDFIRQSRTISGGTTVTFAPRPDPASNDREVFYRTTGWHYRIPTWFFYFRKVNFPPDPRVHGGWEWAGIYFGDRL